MIRLHDKEFRLYINTKELDTQIKRLAHEVSLQMQGKKPIFVVILNGAFMFASDFIKHYTGDCEVAFMRLSSYHGGMKSTQEVTETMGLLAEVSGRDVVILEDIVDTGNTLVKIHEYFATRNVASLRMVTLFFKPEVYSKELPIEHIGFSIPNRFIVGYGLDYEELGRNLPEIYQLNTKHMLNLVLFGKPGAGKGTQAAFLKEKYNLVHISTGDLFRYNIKNETELGKMAKAFIDNGDLVPDELTIRILQDEIEKNPQAQGFIFDGFPRTIAQAEALDKFLASKEMEISATLALDAPDQELIQRLVERGKVSGRTDDQDEEKIKNRFVEYNQKTAPLIDYYQKQAKLKKINGIGSIEEITQRLSQEIDQLA